MHQSLYVSATDRLMLDGYEMQNVAGAKELETVRDVRQTPHTFNLDETATPTRKAYPIGAIVITQGQFALKLISRLLATE